MFLPHCGINMYKGSFDNSDIFSTIFILTHTDLSNNVDISKAVQIILILYLIRISVGCTLYIKKQYEEQKYSYGIVMNLGLLIFIKG